MRHSSLTIAVKSSNIGTRFNLGKEELLKVLVLCCDLRYRSGMDEVTLVQDGKVRADLFGNFENMCGYKDGIAFFNVPVRKSLTVLCIIGSKLINGSSIKASVGLWRNAWANISFGGYPVKDLCREHRVYLQNQGNQTTMPPSHRYRVSFAPHRQNAGIQ